MCSLKEALYDLCILFRSSYCIACKKFPNKCNVHRDRKSQELVLEPSLASKTKAYITVIDMQLLYCDPGNLCCFIQVIKIKQCDNLIWERYDIIYLLPARGTNLSTVVNIVSLWT